jgi:hypothetical protein
MGCHGTTTTLSAYSKLNEHKHILAQQIACAARHAIKTGTAVGFWCCWHNPASSTNALFPYPSTTAATVATLTHSLSKGATPCSRPSQTYLPVALVSGMGVAIDLSEGINPRPKLRLLPLPAQSMPKYRTGEALPRTPGSGIRLIAPAGGVPLVTHTRCRTGTSTTEPFTAMPTPAHAQPLSSTKPRGAC